MDFILRATLRALDQVEPHNNTLPRTKPATTRRERQQIVSSPKQKSQHRQFTADSIRLYQQLFHRPSRLTAAEEVAGVIENRNDEAS